MQCGAQLSSAWQNEFTQRLQLFKQQVDQALHLGHAFFSDSRDLNLQRAGQVGADDEKLILNFAERLIQLRVGQADSRGAQQRIQFIDVAVGDDAWIGLADAASVDQRGLARVAALCVNTTDSHCSPLRKITGNYRMGLIGLRGLIGPQTAPPMSPIIPISPIRKFLGTISIITAIRRQIAASSPRPTRGAIGDRKRSRPAATILENSAKATDRSNGP